MALTSHIVKVFELVRQSLVRHLEKNNLLPSGQHGFRAFRSTLTQLLQYWDKILEDLQQGGAVDSVYLDFAKAFDKVETGVLLHKLKSFEIQGKVGCWLAAFLNSNNRKQAVAVQRRISSLSPVISGVPQGTVLGPILFLIHIADIAKDVSPTTSTSSFADDTRARRAIKNPIDSDMLQQDMETIYRWADEKNMKFNSDKFECLRFWPGRESAPSKQYLAPDGSVIEEKRHLRDLGVELSSDLSFAIHIQNTITAASRMVGWALRTFRRRSRLIMMTIWKTLVQPKMDYCSQLWSPSDQTSITQLESVQRHFTSRILGLDGKDYWERLNDLKLYSQERRRERYQIIFLWKVSQCLVQGYEIDFVNEGRRGRLAQPKSINWHAPVSVRRARESSLAVKGAHLFNLLPKNIRDIDAIKVEHFKSKLDVFLDGVPDQPTIPGRPRAAETNSLLHQIPLLLMGGNG